MRRKKRWTDAEVEKLRSMVGKHSQDQIAQELGRSPRELGPSSRQGAGVLLFGKVVAEKLPGVFAVHFRGHPG